MYVILRYEIGRVRGTFGGEEKSIQGFGGKHEKKRKLGTHRRKRKDDIKNVSSSRVIEAWTWFIWIRKGTVG